MHQQLTVNVLREDAIKNMPILVRVTCFFHAQSTRMVVSGIEIGPRWVCLMVIPMAVNSIPL